MLDDIAPTLMRYTNGGSAHLYPGWLYVRARPYMVIVFSCLSGCSLEDLSHSLRLEMAASPSIDAHFLNGSYDSMHACGLLLLSPGALPWVSDVVSLLRRLPIDPVHTRLWCRPNFRFIDDEILPWLGDGTAWISPSPEKMNIDWPGAVHGGHGDGEHKVVDRDMMETDMMETDMMETDMMDSDMMDSDMMDSDMMDSDMMDSDMMDTED